MTGVRKIISLILLAAVTACCVLSLCSCRNRDESGVFLVYYTNMAQDDIVYKSYQVDGFESMSPKELTDELLYRMFSTDVEADQLCSAKPENVTIKEYHINDGQIIFDFDGNYLELTNVQEILLRAALVLTLIQEPDISQVVFTVDGEPLKDSNGREIGSMSAGNFVNILLSEEGMLKQETDLTLFFTDETGTRLIPAKYHFTINNSNTSMEEYMLQQLKAGPAIEGTYPTMSSDVEILSVVTSDYVCYVNFGSNFLEQEQPASDEILIYSIVNSLCTLTYVNSVQFLVNGSSDVVLHTVTDCSSPLRRNRELEH